MTGSTWNINIHPLIFFSSVRIKMHGKNLTVSCRACNKPLSAEGKVSSEKNSFQQYQWSLPSPLPWRASVMVLAEGSGRWCHGLESESLIDWFSNVSCIPDDMEDCCKCQSIPTWIFPDLLNIRHLWASFTTTSLIIVMWWQVRYWDPAGLQLNGVLMAHSLKLTFFFVLFFSALMNRCEYLWYHFLNYSWVWWLSSAHFSCFLGWPWWQKYPLACPWSMLNLAQERSLKHGEFT